MPKIRHHLKKARESEFTKILILRTVGNFLILSSVFLIAKTLSQPVYEEIRYFVDQVQGKTYIAAGTKVEPAKKGQLAAAIKKGKVEVLTPKDPNFSIVVPKIGANSPIIPSVNAADENEYLPALQRGVAHAAGTAFPGEHGHIFLFAHSTDYFWNVGTYNAVFYLLYKLEKGDEVNIFYHGKRYVYRVVEKTIVDPSQVEYLTRKSKNEFLTLQTCWPLGTTLKRLLVFAAPVAK